MIFESIQTSYGFHLEYLDNNNQILSDRRLKIADFAHAIRCAEFAAYRQGLVGAYQPWTTNAIIEPLFPNNGVSSPRTTGFNVTIHSADLCPHTCSFDIRYFGSIANRMRAELIRNQTIGRNDSLFYRLNAFLDEDEPPRPPSKLAISLTTATEPIDVSASCLDDYQPIEIWDDPNDTEMPILVDRVVLEEIVTEARINIEREIAGFLLGHLKRDIQTKKVFLVITGLASANGTTEASDISVTYTPASFIQAREIARLRDLNERVCGWYHSHPFKLCANCPTPARPPCINTIMHYSMDDFHLMETTFDQPFMIGLVTSIEPRIEEALGHLPVKLYGWVHGTIQPRGFAVAGTPAT